MNLLKKTSLCFIFICLISTIISAQESSTKIYSNWLYFSEQYPRQFDYDKPDFYFSGLTVAYRKINTKSKFHQFELSLKLKQQDEPDDYFKRISTYIRYERGKHFENKILGIIDFQFSGSGKLYYLKEDINSLSFSEYEAKRTEAGFNFALFTNFGYDLGKRFYIELSTSIIGATISTEFQTVYNPNLTKNQQKQGGFDFDLLDERILRIGLAYVFPGKDDSNL